MKTVSKILILLVLYLFAKTEILKAQNIKGKFVSDSVIFYNSDKSIRFSGTITIPAGGKQTAAVVIVSGTGKQTKDGDMARHKQFKTIADYLSSHNITVLRVDDRGVGNTTGVYENSTTEDFANDALTAINYLKTRDEVDSNKIGLLGHSEGGIAISIAAAKSKDVKFLVSLAGLAMSGFDAQIKQNIDIVAAADIPDYDKKRFNEINRLLFEVAFKFADSPNMDRELCETYNSWKKKDDVYFKTLNVKFDHFRFSMINYLQMATGPWYRYFIKYDARKVMANIKVPVLALNGDKDLMVACNENLKNWKNYTGGNGTKDVTTVVVPGVNHIFLPCITCTNEESWKLKSEFSNFALDTITSWINSRFK